MNWCSTLDFDPASDELHKQCGLTSGDSRMVAWIPTKHAKVGNRVRLVGDDGMWTVDTVGTVEIEQWRLEPRRHDPVEMPNAEQWAKVNETLRSRRVAEEFIDWAAFGGNADPRKWITPPEGITLDGIHP